jgi:hypothetical protein
MPDVDPTTVARQRLGGAGLSDDEIALLIERASQVVEGLARLAALDLELPEPALTWRPVEEAAS